MINESPDYLKNRGNIDNPSWNEADNVTFILGENFFLYGLWSQCTHGHLFDYLTEKYNTYVDYSKHKFVQVGHLSHNELDNINRLSAVVSSFTETGFVGSLSKNSPRKNLPDIIQGRAWTESRVISFWNELVYIKSRRNQIIEFIKLIGGDPNEYQYEIKDKLYSYEDFSSGKYSDNLKFDPGVVHTLSPDKKGDALRQMGVQPKKPMPLQFKQMIQGESLCFREFLEKLENWLNFN